MDLLTNILFYGCLISGWLLVIWAIGSSTRIKALFIGGALVLIPHIMLVTWVIQSL